MMSAEEFNEMYLKGPKPNKYGAQRTAYDGVSYPSRLEARRAGELNLLLKAGEIITWARQPQFKMGPTSIGYKADFLVIDKSGAIWAEDVKGFIPDRFKIIKSLWIQFGLYPLRILKRKKSEWSTETVEPKKLGK